MWESLDGVKLSDLLASMYKTVHSLTRLLCRFAVVGVVVFRTVEIIKPDVASGPNAVFHTQTEFCFYVKHKKVQKPHHFQYLCCILKPFCP